MTIIVAGLPAFTPLLGQQPSGVKERSDMAGMGMMSMMGDCPMMTATKQGPKGALARRKALALTDSQVKKLEVLRDQAQTAMRQSMNSMAALHKEFAPLAVRDRFDESAVRALFDRMGALHTEMGVSAMRVMYDTRFVLTAEQRQKLAGGGQGSMTGMGKMGGKDMSAHGMAGMESCPMMDGMMGEMARDSAGAAGEKERSGKERRRPANTPHGQMPMKQPPQ